MQPTAPPKPTPYLTAMKVAVGLSVMPVLGFVGKFAGMALAAWIKANGGEGIPAFRLAAAISQWSIAVTFVIGFVGFGMFGVLFWLHVLQVRREGTLSEPASAPDPLSTPTDSR